MARFGEFNTIGRACAAAALALACLSATSVADEIRKWRDADGKLHYSVTGAADREGDAPSSAVLSGRETTPDEAFSVSASLRRREIERKLTAAGRDLEAVRVEIEAASRKTFDAWVPAVVGDPRTAQASLDAQRDAFLAARQFEQEKDDTLRRLKRRERRELREVVALWHELDKLGAEVAAYYGKPPGWWRNRLDCGGCPTLAQAEESLRPAKRDGSDEAKTAKRAADDDEEDDEQGWEPAWE